jgi:hypothetical protein
MAPPPRPGGSRPLTLARNFARAADIPPRGVGAYGVVALRSKATPANTDRLMMLCRAFEASLPRQDSLPKSVSVADQMVTVWPLDSPGAPQARADDCVFAVSHYDLEGGLSAIRDARAQGARMKGLGPYLIGWSPAAARGVRGKLVLVIDMSALNSQDSFDREFAFWQDRVVADPALWRSGFSLRTMRLAVRDFFDKYGQSAVDAVKLFGGKG